MSCVLLPTPQILIDGDQAVGAVSRLSFVGGHDLTIVTTLPYLAVSAHSCFVADNDEACAAVHMVRAAGRLLSVRAVPQSPGGTRRRTQRVQSLLEHYAQLQSALTECGRVVHVELAEDALALAGGTR